MPHTLLTRTYLILSAAAFAWIGLKTMLNPQLALAGLELLPTSPTGLNEIRANYGMMHVAFATVILLGLRGGDYLRTALVLNIAVAGGLVLGRLSSMALDGMPNTVALVLLGIEVVSVLCATLVWRVACKA